MYVRVRHFSDGKEVETGSGILRLDKKNTLSYSHRVMKKIEPHEYHKIIYFTGFKIKLLKI